jgi:uncharacterized protein YjbI with pentapeptide repeats
MSRLLAPPMHRPTSNALDGNRRTRLGRGRLHTATATVWVALGLMVLIPPAGNAATSATDADKLQAEVDKLKAETAKLEGDNNVWARLPPYGAALAALVAIGGLFLTLQQQRQDRLKDKAARQEQAEKDKRDRDDAALRRFDEQYTQIVTSLSSNSPAVRGSAAASIATFLQPEYERFHDQVFDLLSAALKFPQGNVTDRLVERAFVRALRDRVDREPSAGADLDLSRATLRDADISHLVLDRCDCAGADLGGTDLGGARLVGARGPKVDLSGASLSETNLEEAALHEARLVGARLHGARLVSAKLQQANAQHASFDGATLQEANFDNADVRAATFRGANLNNAFFRGARFDQPALRSILLAKNWRKANYDPATRNRLEAMVP